MTPRVVTSTAIVDRTATLAKIPENRAPYRRSCSHTLWYVKNGHNFLLHFRTQIVYSKHIVRVYRSYERGYKVVSEHNLRASICATCAALVTSGAACIAHKPFMALAQACALSLPRSHNTQKRTSRCTCTNTHTRRSQAAIHLDERVFCTCDCEK